jgi:hypothetical protein
MVQMPKSRSKADFLKSPADISIEEKIILNVI